MDDVVEAVLRQWQRLDPDLDTAPMALIGRLNRCSALLQQAADAPLIGAGLTRPEFDVLGTLRRVDRDLTPGRLARETFSSGAAVTKPIFSFPGGRRFHFLDPSGNELAAMQVDPA